VTRFCPWYPLVDAAREAPATPGVYQVRAADLCAYPTGKSAMIRYGAADDVRAALLALAAAHPGATWRARHLEDAVRAPAAELAALVERFRRRFGAEPTLPEAS
jgi:hypothetical protein